MPAVAFIGAGEVACALAAGLRDAGAGDLRAWSRPRPDPEARGAQRRRAEAAGLRLLPSLADALWDVDAVVASVPSSAARGVAEASAARLSPGTLYADVSPLPPGDKQYMAGLVGAGGGRFVDAALLGTVATEGHRVPLLVSGPGAQAWHDFASPLGLDVTVTEGPAGQAATVKLLRSVFMKGRDALILEMLVAARAHGVEREVVESIRGPGERVPFPDLAGRVVCALAAHAGRRADELEAAADLVRAAHVEPVVSEAGALRLRWLAELGLRERFNGERPGDPAEVLAALDDLLFARSQRVALQAF